MLVPILATGGVLLALYATRGEATVLEPGRRYLLGAEQEGVTAADVEATRLFLQTAGFRNVVYTRSSTVDGRRVHWFKGTWSGDDFAIDPNHPVHVYEVLF